LYSEMFQKSSLNFAVNRAHDGEAITRELVAASSRLSEGYTCFGDKKIYPSSGIYYLGQICGLSISNYGIFNHLDPEIFF